MGYIYIIRNTINDRCYIGQTKMKLGRRFALHKYDSDRFGFPLYFAMRKYGKENFYIEPLEQVDNSKLDEREIYWINKLDTYNKGYNASRGGLGNNSHTDQERAEWRRLYKEGKTAREIREITGASINSIRREVEQMPNYKKYQREHYKKANAINRSKMKHKTLCQYDLLGNLVATYNGIFDIKRQMGDSKRRAIQQILTNKSGVCMQSRWAYLGDEPSAIPTHSLKVYQKKGIL